jgi:hypothetical protein
MGISPTFLTIPVTVMGSDNRGKGGEKLSRTRARSNAAWTVRLMSSILSVPALPVDEGMTRQRILTWRIPASERGRSLADST